MKISRDIAEQFERNHSELCSLLLKQALSQRVKGKGPFSRAEANAAIVFLGLNSAPSEEELEKRLAFALIAFDSALRSSTEIGRFWLWGTLLADKLESSGPNAIEKYLQAATGAEIGRLSAFFEPRFAHFRADRELLRKAASTAKRGESARAIAGYASYLGSPLPVASLAESPWEVNSTAEWPLAPKIQEELSRTFNIALSQLMRDLAWSLEAGLGLIKGSFRNHVPETLGEKFAHGGLLGSLWMDDFLFMPLLDHFFVPNPDQVLKALLAYLRIARARTLLSNRGVFGSLLIALAVDDQVYIPSMVPNELKAPKKFEGPFHAIHYVLCMIHKRIPADALTTPLPKATGWFQGMIDSVLGILRKDEELLLKGLEGVLKGHRKLTNGGFCGPGFQLISLDAIALQRVARHQGLSVDPMKHPLNDAALVLAPHPKIPELRWPVLPGMNSFLQQPEPDLSTLFTHSALAGGTSHNSM